jgi:hypothetical protein
MGDRTCSVDGCAKKAHCGGFCGAHYHRFVRYGDPLAGQAFTEPERFWSKVDKAGPVSDYRPDLGPCWIWKPGRPGKYGLAMWQGRVQPAHRIAYMDLVGPIPDGLHLDHLCRVTTCVNPAHLEPVTPGENVHRGNQARGRGGHGARRTYLQGCRCDQCCATGRAYSREYKKRRRAAGA